MRAGHLFGAIPLQLTYYVLQVVDDKQVLRKFAHTLQQRREDQE